MTRLAPTPSTDACLYTMSGAALLPLAIPPYSRQLSESDSFAARRASIDKVHREVRASCLYPIIPPLLVHPLSPRLWTSDAFEWAGLWKEAMHGAGYTDAATSAESYRRTILKGEDAGLGLFGTTRNPLACVVKLSQQVGRSAILLHYVTAVTLQYYLMARRLVLRARTDTGAPFSEALPPYLYMMFRAQHWKIEQGMVEALPSVATAEELDKLASYNSFPLVLYQVLRWVQTTYPEAAALTLFGRSKDHVHSFCFEKLRKNFLQALMCMRFREAVPVNACAAVNAALAGVASGPAVECIIKFFPHPKAGTIRTLDVKATPPEVVDRSPQFFAHCFFSPYEPVFVSADASVGASALWQLLLYYPLSDFDKTVLSSARNVFDVMPTAPGIESLNAVRSRYTFYVCHDTAYALVPNLLLAEDAIAHDESNVLNISPMAWEWLCNNSPSPGVFSLCAGGERYSTSAREGLLPVVEHQLYYNRALVGHLTATECTLARTHLLGQGAAPVHAYWYFALIRRLTGSEALAARSAVQQHFTLEQIQSSYVSIRKAMLDALVAHFPSEPLTALRASWDRCTDTGTCMPALSPNQTEMLHLTWRVLFPSAAIGFGASTWVAHWRRAEEIPSLMQAMNHVKAALSRSSIVHELSCVSAIERTPAHMTALRMLEHMIQLCPDDMGAGVCGLLPKVQRALVIQ